MASEGSLVLKRDKALLSGAVEVLLMDALEVNLRRPQCRFERDSL